jgi:hypothetical protein
MEELRNENQRLTRDNEQNASAATQWRHEARAHEIRETSRRSYSRNRY